MAFFAPLLLFGSACGPGGAADGTSGRREPPRIGNPEELDQRVVERIDEARQAVLQRPDDPRTWAALGMIFENERMRGRAVECYAEAARMDPDEARWWFHMAGALSKIDRNDEAIEAIETSLGLHADYAPSHARLGNFKFEAGYLDEARAAYEHSIEVDTTYPGGWVGLARVQLQMDETEAAIEILERVLEERPQDLLVKRVLVGAYRQAGRPGELELPDDASPKTERWPDPWAEEVRAHQDDPALRRVTKFLMEGKQLEALAVLEKLRDKAQSPDDERAYLSQLAGIYLSLERMRDAETAYRRLLQIQPENSQVLLSLAEVYEKKGELPNAVQAMRKALELNPNYAPGYRQAGRIYYKATLFAEAAEAFEKVRAYDKDSTGILYLLSMSRFGEKNWEAAEACFMELLEAEPDHADGWFGFARTNLKLRRLDKAERALETAKAKGFADEQMIKQVTGSLQRARQRAAARGVQGG